MTTKALIKLLKKVPDDTKVSVHNPKEDRWVDWVELKPSMVEMVNHGDDDFQVYIGGPRISA